MNKLRIFALVFIVGISLFLCVACGENPEVKFSQASLNMAVGTEIDVGEYLQYKNIEINSIQLVSSNPSVVYIKPNGNIFSRAEGNVVITAEGFSNAMMEVSVYGTGKSFNVPSNINYVESSSMVIWDSVYIGETVATEYEVKVTSGVGQQAITRTSIVNTNSVAVSGSGEISVAVKALAKNGVLESDFSSLYTFTILSEPYNVIYNDNTKKLEWNAVSSTTSFVVSVNGILSDVLETKSMSLDLSAAGTYEIEVYSYSQQENVFGKKSSDKLTLIRREAPNISVINGELVWTNVNKEIGYRVSISGSAVRAFDLVDNLNNNCKYLFGDVPAGEYNVEVYAKGEGATKRYGNGQHILQGEAASVTELKKLATPVIEFEKETNTINFVGITSLDNQRFSLLKYTDGEYEGAIEVDDGELEISVATGRTSYKAICLAKTNKEINSSVSGEIVINKFSFAKNIKQAILPGTVGDNEVLIHSISYEVDYSTPDTKYAIFYYNRTLGQDVVIQNNDYSIDSVFAEAGQYVFKITASQADAVINNTKYYYISSETISQLTITRLADVDLSDDGSQILWQDFVEGNIKFNYELITGEDIVAQGNTLNTYFDYPSDVGAYNLKVYAEYANQQNADNIILRSLNVSQIDFIVEKTLDAPILNFIKEDEQYYLAVKKDVCVSNYDVIVNNVDANFDFDTENNRFDVTDAFASGNEWSFTVVAHGINQYYLDSEPSEINVKRIDMPESVTVYANENISVNGSLPTGALKSEIYVKANCEGDYEPFVSLDNDKSSFEIKAKYVANSNIVDNSYYIDSDDFCFTLTRQEVLTDFDINTNEITFTSDNSDDYNKVLYLANGEDIFVKQLPVTDTFIDLFDLIDQSEASIADGIKVYVNFKQADNFEVTENNNYLIGSLKTFILNINSATQRNIQLSEDGDNLVARLLMKVDGATYYNSTVYEDKTGDKAQILLSDIEVEDEQSFAFKEVLASGEINALCFSAQKLNKVTQLNVEDEILSYESPSISSGISLKISGAEISEQFTLANALNDGEIVTVVARLVGKQIAEKMYISSDEAEFNFKRLQQYDTLFAGAITINRDTLKIEKEDDCSYSYVIQFVGEDDGFIRQYNVLDAEFIEIDVSSTDMLGLLNDLGDNKHFNIQKLVSISVVNCGDEINYFNSLLSNDINIKMPTNPTNVAVVVTGDLDKQDELTISWSINQDEIDAGYEIENFNVCFTLNGIKQDDVLTTTATSINNNNFDIYSYLSGAGVWGISIQAVGLNDTINSVYSDEIFITRLETSKKVELSKSGLLSFSKVENALGYILKIKDNLSESLNLTIRLSEQENSYQLTDEELEIAYSGELNVVIYALGDATEYLTSKTEKIFQRLASPDIMLENDIINVFNYDEDTNVMYTATIDGNVVASGVLAGTINTVNTLLAPYPKEYCYYDNGVKVFVDFSTNKDVTFEFYATHNEGGALDSNKITKNATILANYSVLGFKREVDDIIHLYISNEESIFATTNVQLFNISAGNTRQNVVGGDIGAINDVVDIEIDEEMLKQISNLWEVKYHVVGGQYDNRTYIDSLDGVISGKKLSTVDGITTNKGKLVWDTINGVIKYSVYVDGEKFSEVEQATENFEGLEADDHLVKVRAYGNIGTSDYVLENVVLDSSLQDEIITITKLKQINNIDAKLGFIVFDELLQDGKYMIVLYEDINENPVAEYELTEYSFANIDVAFNYYYSDELRALLANGDSYYAKFYFKAENEFDINSDLSIIDVNGDLADYVRICEYSYGVYDILLSHPEDNNVTTYTLTNAEIVLDANSTNGYFVNIDGEIIYKFSDDTIIRLDNDGDWKVGRHTLSYAQIGPNGIDNQRTIYFTPDFGEEFVVTKLGTTDISIMQSLTPTQLLIKYTAVSSANSYYLYFGDNQTIQRNSAGMISPDDLPVGVYDYLAVRAINTQDLTVLAGDKSYLTIQDVLVNGDIIPELQLMINKPSEPEEMTQKDGALRWEVNDLSTFINLLNNGYTTKPYYIFQNQDGLSNRLIYITFTSTQNGTEYSYQGNAHNFLYFTDNLISNIALYSSEYADYLKNFQNGFPSEDFGFQEFASALPAGEYTIKYRILGNEVELFSSIDGIEGHLFVTSGVTELKEGGFAAKKYVPSAPSNLQIVNDNDVHKLQFMSVSVSGSYVNQYVKYALVAEYDNQDGTKSREIISILNTEEKSDGRLLEFNLTDLVNSDKLLPTHKSLMVYVFGDDNNVLSGKVSTVVPITVLKEISSYMSAGQLHIRAQEGASKYVINLTGRVDEIEIQSLPDVMEYIWNGDNEALTEGLEYYMSIYAYGSSNDAVGNAVISGKITNLGKIVKLEKINDINVIDGIFNWSNIDNATGYNVYCARQGTLPSTPISISTNYYDTQVSDNRIYSYFFMANGTDDQILNDSTTVYLNSVISAEYLAKRIEAVEELSIYDGFAIWQSQYSNVNGIRYLMAITGEGKEPITIDVGNDSTVINVFGNNNKYADIKSCLTYDMSEDFADGNYILEISTFYEENTNINGVLQLRSNINSINFNKLAKVYDVRVESGRITWKYDGTEQHYYKLTFTTNLPSDGTVVLYTESEEYDNVVYNLPDYITGITLDIQVVPGLIEEAVQSNFISSMLVQYDYEISQIASLPNDSVITYIDEMGNLIVSWNDGMEELVSAVNLDLYKYELKYKFNAQDDYSAIVINETSYIVEEFDVNSEFHIMLRIIPINNNYISSAWTEEKIIAVPSEVTGIYFDELDYCFKWDLYDGDGTIEYIITDEIGHYNEDEFVVDKIYRVRANKQDTRYEPFEVGYHKLGIAVIITNSNTGLLSGTVYSDIVNFDLFESGNGTPIDPYQINNVNQFKNINYRLTKDNLKSAYYVAVRSEDDPECELFSLINREDFGTQYYFRQISNIDITENYNIKNAFKGIYDGNYYKLTLSEIIEEGAIFNTISSGAIVKNTELELLVDTITVNSNFAVLCYSNEGSISNIRVSGSFIPTCSSISLTLSYISNTNKGRISNIDILCNTDISCGGKALTEINFAPVSIYNYGKISWIKSVGDIKISNFAMNKISGICVNSTKASIDNPAFVEDSESGLIENCAFIGDIKISTNLKAKITFGGIVAEAEGLNIINNCYVISKITVAGQNIDNTQTYIGGIVGYLDGKLTINDVYSIITIGQDNLYDEIYKLFGKVITSNVDLEYVYIPNHDDSYIYEIGGANASPILDMLSNYTDYNDLTRGDHTFIKNGDLIELDWSQNIVANEYWKSEQD